MLTRFRSLFRRGRLEREMDAELRHHLESLEAEHRARGLSADEARLAALRDFGSVARTQDAYRDQRGLPLLETVSRDVRFGIRSLRRTPVATIAIVATLAAGIGANTAIFSIVNRLLIEPLPYPDANRLIAVSYAAPGLNIANVSSSPFLYFTHRDHSRTLDGVGLVGAGTATVTGLGEPEQVRRVTVTSQILPMLRVEPLLGRWFSEADDTPGAPETVILTYGYWQRRFGGDSSVVGQRLTMNGQPRDIVGVMPAAFLLPIGQPDVIVPYRLDRSAVTVGGFFWQSIGRLRPGVTLDQARADLAGMVPLAVAAFPLGPGVTSEQIEGLRLTPVPRPLKEQVLGEAGAILWVLMGAMGFVLLVACANVVNLMLARTESRQHELAIRAAIGAGRGRIARGLFTETMVLGLAGGALGIGLAYAALPALLAMAPSNLPRIDEISVDRSVLLFTLVLSLVAGLVLGLMPVVRYAGSRRAATLQAGARRSVGSRMRRRERHALVVVQVALALVLLVGAGLMVRTSRELSNVHPGFTSPGGIQILSIDIPQAAAPEPERVVRRQQEILDNLAALPGVTSVAYTSAVPMGGGVVADLLVPEGKVFREGEVPVGRQVRFISPGLFDTLGTPLVAGRDITWTDLYDRRPVMIVSENIARVEWGSPEAALGRRMRGGSSEDQWREVVGVAGDVYDRGLHEAATEIVYVPGLAERIFNSATFVSRFATFALRTSRTGDPRFLDDVRHAVWAIDANLPLMNVRTMDDLVRDSMARTSVALVLLALAGAMALLLAVIGVYGVVSYAVAERTGEVGIRIALGARHAEVQRLFVRQGLAPAVVGVAIGLAGAFGLTRLMSSLLFDVSPLDPLTYVVVSVLLLSAAGLATWLPCRRATRIDPIAALRAE